MTQLVRKEQCLSFIAIPDHRGRYPVTALLDSLGKRERGQFAALARLMDRAHTLGFGYSGRVSKVKGSKVGLLEFRVTPKGGVSPHVRLFGVMRGTKVYLATGYVKKEQALDRGVVGAAEALVASWEERRSAGSGSIQKPSAKARGQRRSP